MTNSAALKPVLALASAIYLSAIYNPAVADTLDIFSLQSRPVATNAGSTVAMTARLPLLSQQVVAAGCFVRANIDTGNTLPSLINSTNEFTAIVDTLDASDHQWNAKIGLPARTQMSLQELQRQWEPVAAQARQLWTDSSSASEIALLDARGSELLEMASIVSSDITAQNTWPNGVLQSTAMQIYIAQRQQMLAQQISKSACLFVTGVGDDTTLSEMTDAANDFEVSLFALYHGMPEVGLLEPPNGTVSAAISDAIVEWNVLKPMLSATDELDISTLAEINANVGLISEDFELIATLYREVSALSR